MSVFPGGFNLVQAADFKSLELYERVKELEKRNTELTALLAKNTEYLLKEILALKARIDGPLPTAKVEEKKEDADIDAIILRLNEKVSTPTTLSKPETSDRQFQLQPGTHQPAIHRHSSALPMLQAPTNEKVEQAKQLGEVIDAFEPAKQLGEVIGAFEPAKQLGEAIEPAKQSINLGGILCGWDWDKLKPYMETPEVGGRENIGLTKTESDAAVEKGACIRPAVWHNTKIKPDTNKVVEPAVWHNTKIKPDTNKVVEPATATATFNLTAPLGHGVPINVQFDRESSAKQQQSRQLSQPPSRKRSIPNQKRVVFPTPATDTEPRLIMRPKCLSAVPTLDLLIWACSRRNSVQALEFIKNNAPICIDRNGDTALIWACANKMPEVALMLVGCNLLLGHIDREGNTALIWACVHNMREVIDALMSTDKANVAHTNRQKQTAKMWIAHHKRNFEAEEAKKAATPSVPNRDVVVEKSAPNRDVVVKKSAPNRDVVVEKSAPNRDVVVVEAGTEPLKKMREKALTFVLNISSNEALDAAMMAQWRPFRKACDGHVTHSGYKMGCIETHVPALYPTIAASFSDKPSTRFFESTTEVNQWLTTTLLHPFALTVPEDAKSEDSFVVVPDGV